MAMTTTTTRAQAGAQDVRFDAGPLTLHGQFTLVDERAPSLLLLHGLGFYSFEYEALARLLGDHGFNCLAFDHRCHGHSEGPRGLWTLAELVEDARQALGWLATQVTGRIGVFGNSMGALVGVHLAVADARVGSLVASGCPTRVKGFGVTPGRRALLGLLKAVDAIVPLRVSVNHFIPYRSILLEPASIERVQRDPLITDARRFRPSTYADIFGWDALEVVGRLRTPLLVLYALRDGLQPPAQSQMLFEAASGHKEIRALDTGHVPDLDRPDLLAPVLVDWFGRTLRA